MAVANGGYPFTQRDVVTEIYGDSSNRSLTELFSAAIGTFDPNYVGSKNSLYNFRNYQHIIPNGGYGRLYNVYSILDSRNIAPVGWHLPSRAEYNTLGIAIGGLMNAAKFLKSSGTAYWQNSSTQGIDAYLFNGKGAGIRAHDGSFTAMHYMSYMFTSDMEFLEIPYQNIARMIADSYELNIDTYIPRSSGSSIRLIKDDSNNTGIMTDNSGYTYKTVKIGNQVWMASNLRGTKYRNGDTIPTVTDNATWAGLSTGACCSYNNNDTWSYDNNYVLPGTTVRIEINNGFDGTNYYLYAQAIDVNTGAPRGTNIDVTINFSYTYFSLKLGEDVTVNRSYIIYALANQSAQHIIPRPLVNYTPTSVSPTNYNGYTYII